MGYQRLLITLDGSKFAELALEQATKVAAPGAAIHLLSVVTTNQMAEMAALAGLVGQQYTIPNDVWPPRTTYTLHEVVAEWEAYLKQTANRLTERGYQVTTEARPGNIVDQIVSVARDGFEVLIMATHGRTGLSKLAFGSVAEAVLHKTPCPVLLVPASQPVL